MRHSILALLMLVVITATGGYAAGKVTVDPNAARLAVTPDSSGKQPDNRLDRKITYDGGYLRLHAVTDDLSKATGVTIRCGKNGQDWQVRDIPMVVCVKDMPLGKLLQAIAAATHTELLTGETSLDGGKKSIVYRICRSRKGDAELREPIASQEKATRELAKWAWDALASLPPASVKSATDKGPADPIPAETRLTSRIFAALGSGERDKLLAGEALTVRAKDVLPLALVKDIVAGGIERLCSYGDMYRQAAVTDTDINRTTLSVKFCKLDDRQRMDDSLWLSVQGIPIEMKTLKTFSKPASEAKFERLDRPWQAEPIRWAKALLAVDGIKVAASPDVDAMLSENDAKPGPGLVPLRADKDWAMAMLQGKTKIEFPSDRGLINQSDVIRALAESGNINVVCEDFVSHKHNCRYLPSKDFGAGARDVLEKLQERRGEIDEMRWFADENQNLLIGWANGWQHHHVDLAPERIIANIHAKCIGPGAEIDDLVPIFGLSSGQLSEWVTQGCDVPRFMPNMRGLEEGIWQVYDALSPEDKAAVRSESGLALAKFDPAWIGGILSQSQRRFAEHTVKDRLDEDLPPVLWEREEMLSDPAFVASATMRMKSEPLEAWRTMSLMPGTAQLRDDLEVYRPGTDGLRKHFYTIELIGFRNGAEAKMVSKWEFQPFPAFTPEKEAELRAQAAKGSKK